VKQLVGRTLDNTTGDRQLSTHASEVRVNVTSGHAAFVDTPNNQRLTATAITSGEDTRKIGVVLARRSLDVLASILLNLVTKNTSLRAKETHREQDKVSREELLATLNLLHVPTARSTLGPLNTDSVDTLDLASAIVDEVLRKNTVLTRVLAHVGLDLGVTVVNTVDTGPLRPGVVTSTLGRRLRKQLKVDNRLGTVTNGSTDTVVTSVTTTNDNNVLVLGRDVLAVRKTRVEKRFGVLVQELHGEVDTLQVAARNGQVSGDGGTSGKDNGVMLGSKGLEGNITLTNRDTGDKVDALSSHEVNTALDDVLIELHVGDTIHEQTTDTVGSLVDGDTVASLVQLVSSCHTSGTGTNNGDSLATADLRRRRNHPAHLETTVNNGALDGLDANGVLVDTKNASTLARSRANTTSELGEVVGHEQSVQSVPPLVLEDQFVPFGDDVRDRAASIRLTERYTTVHATSGLVFELVLVQTLRKLLPVASSGLSAAVLLRATLVLHETLGLVEDKSRALLLSLAVLDTLLDIEKVVLLLLTILSLVLLLLRVLVERANRVAWHDGERVLGSLGLGSLLSLLLHDTLVVSRQNLDEAVQGTREVEENTSSKLRTSVVVVVLDKTADKGDLSRVLQRRKLNHLLVDLALKVALHVKNISDTTRHTGSKVSTGRSKNENTTTSHVLATVVTNTLNDSSGTGVSDGETLSTHTAEEALTAGSTVETGVTNDDVLLSLEDCVSGRVDDQTTAGQTLTDIVVAVTLELKSDTGCKEGTEGLTGRATNVGVDGVSGQTLLTVALADLV
jgi:hypothetical protein